MEKEKVRGTVKFFNSEKGFGFIKSDSSKEDVFVHATGIIDTKSRKMTRLNLSSNKGAKALMPSMWSFCVNRYLSYY